MSVETEQAIIFLANVVKMALFGFGMGAVIFFFILIFIAVVTRGRQ